MATAVPIEETSPDFIGSLARGLRVICALGRTSGNLTASDVARATDLSRAVARRMLLTLHSLGYVESTGKHYSLSPKVLELGLSYLSAQDWLAQALPILTQLRDTLDEAISVTILEDTDVVYVARFPVNRVLSISMEIGMRRPAFCTAMGRVLLSGLPPDRASRVLHQSDIRAFTANTITAFDELERQVNAVRERGYCIVDRELDASLVAVSVPLKNLQGQTIAAVDVCGHPASLSLRDLEERCLPALQRAVQNIARIPV